MNMCVVGGSGKLEQYVISHALTRDDQTAAVCREERVTKRDHHRDQRSFVICSALSAIEQAGGISRDEPHPKGARI